MIQFLLTSDAMRFIFEILIIRQLVLNINLYLKVFSNGLFPGLVFFMHRAKVFSLFRELRNYPQFAIDQHRLFTFCRGAVLQLDEPTPCAQEYLVTLRPYSS